MAPDATYAVALLSIAFAGCTGTSGEMRDATPPGLDADAANVDTIASDDAASGDGRPNDGTYDTASDGTYDVTSDGARDGGGDVASDVANPNAVVGPRVDRFVESGAITVTSGMTVSGVHVSTTSGPCIRGSNVRDVHIVDSRIGPCGPDARGVGIDFYDASRIHVDHNVFDDVASGLYVDGHPGPANDIVFDHNRVLRVRGPLPRGQMVQLNHVRGAGHAILCNVDDQTAPGYLAGPEDHVSVFESAGTAASPIRISYNRIRGGGPSTSGGGILAGDAGSSYVDVTDNVLISPGQYGVGIAGGDHARLLRNVIYAPTAFAWSNVGLYVWNQTMAIPCESNEVRGNRVLFVNRMGPNPSWNAGNCGAVVGWATDNIFGDTSLTDAVWNVVFPACD